MRIFISHSTKDKALLHGLRESLEPHGLILLIAEHHKDLTRTTTKKIEKMIDECDVALILLTKQAFKSTFVQQEIGYIKRANKPLLRVIQKGIEKRISGLDYGYDFIALDIKNQEQAIESVRTTLLKFWNETKEEEKRQQLELQKKRELEQQTIRAIGLLAVVIILILVLSSE